MGFRLYKSVRLGKGVRLNLSKTGIGVSAGVPGARYSVHSSGRTTKTVGASGTGVYYRKDTYSRRGRGRSPTPSPPHTSVIYPKAGPLAPKAEKEFVKGVSAYRQQRYMEALTTLQSVVSRDADQAHIGEEFFAALSLVALGRVHEGIQHFETMLASDSSIPDSLMSKYGIGGAIEVSVTPAVSATLPMSNLAVALMLAESYQSTGQRQQAIELLESLGAEAPNEPVFALSLADLYQENDQWDDVIRVTDVVESNEDDVTLNVLAFRAVAMLELDLTEAALTLTKECLRFKKRNPDLLRLARYVRGRAYEREGDAGLANKEFERIYAEDASFADVAQRLGRKQAAVPSLPPRPDTSGS